MLHLRRLYNAGKEIRLIFQLFTYSSDIFRFSTYVYWLLSGRIASDTLDQLFSIPAMFYRSVSHRRCWYLSYRRRW